MTEKVKEAAFYHARIKDWPEGERPREKLLMRGPRALSDAELLALLIESGTGGVTALDLAKRLLVEYHTLSELASKGVAELQRMKGIGPARAARVMAALEVGRRLQKGAASKDVRVDSPEDIVRMKQPEFRGLKKEVFQVMLLDSANKIIRETTISEGTLNASIVHPREVFKTAVDHLAAGVVLLHNHPSGVASPSDEDRKVTRQMVQSGEIMGIPVLDHIILADHTYFSFAKQGLLNK